VFNRTLTELHVNVSSKSHGSFDLAVLSAFIKAQTLGNPAPALIV